MPNDNFGDIEIAVRSTEPCSMIMRSIPSAIFIIHLVQDVSILRPLIFMAARDFGFDTLLLVSTRLTARDASGIWRNELAEISAQCGARIRFFEDDWEAHKYLNGHGLLFAASESNLPQHATAHDLFRHAPRYFLKITLQHGFECVGFRHSADHIRAHGETASFGADIVCSWGGGELLKSMASSQRPKLFVTGPTSVLQMPAGGFDRNKTGAGLVAENLHSVRFKRTGDLKSEFIGTFAQFSRLMAAKNRKIALRTHPGGQYAIRNGIVLFPNVQVENAPIYRLDLRQFSYGIAPPSSVLIDMLLADIPTAVWRDRRRLIDAAGYEGLACVSSPEEWAEFARHAELRREALVASQRDFLERTGMPLDPQNVYSNFAQLFQAAKRMDMRKPGAAAERDHIAAADSTEQCREALLGAGLPHQEC